MRTKAKTGALTPPLARVIRAGNHIYVSGQVPVKGDGTVVEGGISEQTECVIDNLEAALSEAGATLQDVVKTTVYLSNVKRDFKDMNEVYAKRFGEHRPTRSTIGAELALEALVEIEAVAVIRDVQG